jgi:zinc transporter ZupT
MALLPLLALALMLSVFLFADPLALFKSNLPPLEILSMERIVVTEHGFETTLVNGGPDPVTVAQVTVDDAYWNFEIEPSAVIPRLGRARLSVPYPWVEGEPHVLRVITNTGVTFEGEVLVATLSPKPGWREFGAYGLLGVYVGIIPVGLGMLWFPAMRRLGRKWLGAVLALTLGLLVFLLVDTLFEAFEVAAELPGIFQGIPLVLFSALLTWLVLLAVGSRREGAGSGNRSLYVATLIALSIGLHNLGEGMAIGAAFALGEAALGSFLVIGFTLHNITEGVGIAAPLLPSGGAVKGESRIERPRLVHFLGLTLLAGAPAMLGAWLGGFAFSPVLAAVFLGIGVGAIWQVIVEVTSLLRGYAEREETPLVSWTNVLGFLLGWGLMYLTAFLVSF